MTVSPSETNAGTSGAGESTSPKVENNTVMAILSYLGPLVVIPFWVSKEDPFVHFHVKQGSVLLIISILIWIASSIMWILIPLFYVFHIGVVILSVIGIINVVQGKKKELPVVGKYAEMLHI